ncbi:histidine phosphatase family protein [Candidatus Cetobacterium colombiensis]|uniref:Histidine phosphatase family protein n=1 Tax=Candidatus Cetobacterium colombiensis TaxID=3073100 RepID=A0ABU4WAV3_9FUSO|nr:histidine phosphatase family protein [Candidatus Cetobacterium colombiensis]MDX8336334.1 histidine phosphatase family protein [Candidatus Cetobacterium colombiensis]
MLRIYFVRHGETVWNTLKIFQGRSNSPLTELGIEQAKKLSKYLENINFQKIYSSPQERALHTTKLILGNRKMEITPIEEFQEINMGNVEGIPREEFEKNYPIEYHNFWHNAVEYNPSAYAGESYDEILERVKVGLNKLISENTHGNILVISHGVTLKAIFNIINQKGIDEFSKQPVPENTSTTIVEYDSNKFKIVKFSDTEHLK